MNLASNDPWVLRTGRALRAPRLRLFCLPYAGGGAAVYRSWHEDLPAEIEVCPIQLPGRERRFGEPSFTDAVAAADVVGKALAPYLDTPYALFGHSMGAALAYETARYLVRTYGSQPTCVIVSARRAPHLPSRRAPVHLLPDNLLIDELRRLNGTPRAVLDDAELMEFMLPMVRSDFQVAETYRADPAALPCPVVALGGKRDDDVPVADLEAWRSTSNGDFQVHMIDGDHFFINSRRTEVTAIVSKEIMRHLEPS